jgi:hypothetical protein
MLPSALRVPIESVRATRTRKDSDGQKIAARRQWCGSARHAWRVSPQPSAWLRSTRTATAKTPRRIASRHLERKPRRARAQRRGRVAPRQASQERVGAIRRACSAARTCTARSDYRAAPCVWRGVLGLRFLRGTWARAGQWSSRRAPPVEESSVPTASIAVNPDSTPTKIEGSEGQSGYLPRCAAIANAVRTLLSVFGARLAAGTTATVRAAPSTLIKGQEERKRFCRRSPWG